MLRKHANETEFPDNALQGMFGLRHRFLPAVVDGMQILDEASSQTSRMTVIKCCIKSQCLLDCHVQRWRNIIVDI